MTPRRQGCLKKGYTTPLVADMHFAPKVTAVSELLHDMSPPRRTLDRLLIIIPLSYGVHYWRWNVTGWEGQVALMVADCFDKIRINPGNFADGRFVPHQRAAVPRRRISKLCWIRVVTDMVRIHMTDSV